MKLKYITDHWKSITGENRCRFDPSVVAMIKAAPTLVPSELKQWKIRDCDRSDATKWVPYSINVSASGNKAFPRVLYANIEGSENILELQFREKAPHITLTEWNGYVPISVTYASQDETQDKTPKPSDDELHELALSFIQNVELVSSSAGEIEPSSTDISETTRQKSD